MSVSRFPSSFDALTLSLPPVESQPSRNSTQSSPDLTQPIGADSANPSPLSPQAHNSNRNGEEGINLLRRSDAVAGLQENILIALRSIQREKTDVSR